MSEKKYFICLLIIGILIASGCVSNTVDDSKPSTNQEKNLPPSQIEEIDNSNLFSNKISQYTRNPDVNINFENNGNKLDLDIKVNDLISGSSAILKVKDNNLVPNLIIDSLDIYIDNDFLIDGRVATLQKIDNQNIAEIWIEGCDGNIGKCDSATVLKLKIGENIPNSEYKLTNINSDKIILNKNPEDIIHLKNNVEISFKNLNDNKIIINSKNKEYILEFYYENQNDGIQLKFNTKSFDYVEGYYNTNIGYFLILPNEIELFNQLRNNLFDRLYVIQ